MINTHTYIYVLLPLVTNIEDRANVLEGWGRCGKCLEMLREVAFQSA